MTDFHAVAGVLQSPHDHPTGMAFFWLPSGVRQCCQDPNLSLHEMIGFILFSPMTQGIVFP